MFNGSLVALITPFKNGAVDEKGFEKFVAWQIKEGTDGLVPCGTTGESPTLSMEEHKRVIDICIAAAKGSVEMRPMARPTIGAGDVLLEVANVGVCGSDLHQWTGSHSWKVNYPVMLGHEFGGVIAAKGAAVRDWSEGDRVVSETAAVIDHLRAIDTVALTDHDIRHDPRRMDRYEHVRVGFGMRD